MVSSATSSNSARITIASDNPDAEEDQVRDDKYHNLLETKANNDEWLLVTFLVLRANSFMQEIKNT